jgi:small-conductance mechanosensitive channel
MLEYPGPLAAGFPAWAESTGGAVIAAAIGIALGLAAHWLLYGVVRRLARHSETSTDDTVVAQMARPTRWAMGVLGFVVAARENALLANAWRPFAGLVVPLLLGWIAFALVNAAAAALQFRAEMSTDPIAARSRMTRIAILSRTAMFLIVVITVGLMLLAIPAVREVGVTLVASAGLAALAVGAAAQPALKSFVAGLQMAITEPLRIGDLVVIDGHSGRVEEIRMSFVIVRTWDERAVVVPTSRFLDQTFENWSRKGEMLSGPVFLYLNPATDVEPIRTEFLRYIATRKEWDHRTASLVMSEALADTIELRLAMSAATIGELGDLRCDVREHMLDWLRQEMPGALVRPVAGGTSPGKSAT